MVLTYRNAVSGQTAACVASQEKVQQAGIVVPATMQPDGDIDGVFVRYLRARK